MSDFDPERAVEDRSLLFAARMSPAEADTMILRLAAMIVHEHTVDEDSPKSTKVIITTMMKFLGRVADEIETGKGQPRRGRRKGRV